MNAVSEIPEEWFMDASDLLENRAFYELMQRYRWAQIDGANGDIIPAFEAVKEYVRTYFEPKVRP